MARGRVQPLGEVRGGGGWGGSGCHVGRTKNSNAYLKEETRGIIRMDENQHALKKCNRQTHKQEHTNRLLNIYDK